MSLIGLLYKKSDDWDIPVDLIEAKYAFLKYVNKLGKIRNIVTDIDSENYCIDVDVDVNDDHFHFYYFIDGSYELSLNGKVIDCG